MKQHFFYSWEMSQVQTQSTSNHSIVLIDGEWKQYTFRCDNKKDSKSYKWNDVVYLGTASRHDVKINGVQQ